MEKEISIKLHPNTINIVLMALDNFKGNVTATQIVAIMNYIRSEADKSIRLIDQEAEEELFRKMEEDDT